MTDYYKTRKSATINLASILSLSLGKWEGLKRDRPKNYISKIHATVVVKKESESSAKYVKWKELWTEL